MAKPNLLLITGATGHVGFRTLVYALRAGLEVRATVRSRTKATLLLSRVASKFPRLNLGLAPTYQTSSSTRPRLTFALVPDIAVEGAYDDAMEDITHVIHIASPLLTGSKIPPIPCDQADSFFIRPAVQGTIGLLEAADRCGSVRRVVITSSIVALIPMAQMEGTETRPANTPVRPTDRVPFTSGPYHSEFAAYANSKIAALDAAERWHERECPVFDLVHLHPSFVLGRNDMASSPAECMKGTNSVVLAMLLGRRYGPLAGASVHVDDVARCHVSAAVDMENVLGNASYILSQASTWNDAKSIAARRLPGAMEKRLFVENGSVDTMELDIDTTSSLDTFGPIFQDFEAKVRSVCAQYIRLKSSKEMKRRARSVNCGQRDEMIPSHLISLQRLNA